VSARETLASTLTEQAAVAERIGSPFYRLLVERIRDDVLAGGPTWELLKPYAEEPADEWRVFRALSGVHHMVLAGEVPELAAHYESVGGDGDAEAAWPRVRQAFADMEPEVLEELRHPLQTNETARCGALIGGLLEVARATGGLPLRLRELGASAGLNLHMDHYRYDCDGACCGPADSPVCFRDYWVGGTPPFDAPLTVTERRGCDLEPIDATTREGALLLQSFVWPDERGRLELLRAAIEVARTVPAQVDAASADDWIARVLADVAPGTATVVYHSIFWNYLPSAARARIASAIEDAGAAATSDAPVAWLRFEGDDPSNLTEAHLRLRLWPDGSDRLLGSGGYHWQPIRWAG
jgi:hypothetical protein